MVAASPGAHGTVSKRRSACDFCIVEQESGGAPSPLPRYFHAYRIDHILGFFRIWEIQGDCTAGILGRFRPSLPLTRRELESHGIWDIDRLCEPYITQPLLQRAFGEMAEEVACRYLQEGLHGRYRLRPQYARCAHPTNCNGSGAVLLTWCCRLFHHV